LGPNGSPGTASALDQTFAASLQPVLQSDATADDVPFIAPYQFGLQATQALAASNATLNQADTALSPAAVTPDQTVATVAAADLAQSQETAPGAAQTPTATATLASPADPTTSLVFQAHLGGLAAILSPASTLSIPGAEESLDAPKVAATFAGAATKAFTEGQPYQPNLTSLNAKALAGAATSQVSEIVPAGIVAPAYSPQGAAEAAGSTVGRVLDLRG
jgi:hypothetical protein